THGAVFDLAEGILNFCGGRLTFLTGELGDYLIFQLAQTRIAVLLDGDGVGLGDGRTEFAADGVEQRGIGLRSSPVPARLAGFGGEFFNRLDHRLELFMGKQHRTEHLVFGQLLGFRLDHQHGVLGTGHHHVQAGRLELLVGRVQQVAGFRVEGYTGGADRAVEGNARDSQSRRGTDHRSDIRIGLLAGRHYGADNLHFVLETFWEQRADRAIDQARGQGLFLGRTRFTLEEATGNLAGRVGFFLVVHRQREESLARIGTLGAYHGHQHGHVVIDGNQYGTGGLAGNTPCFEGNGRLTELELLDNRVH